MKVGEFYQQGDVILRKVNNLPKGLKKLDTKILQLGEVTGHKHQFLDQEVEVYIDPKFESNSMTITPDEGKFLVVMGDKPSDLVHEEHRTVPVEPGIYEVDIVREFDYEKLESARVRD